MKKLVALGLLAGLGFFVMTLPPSSYADIREGFVEGCSGGGDSVASCECLLNELSASIPFEDFLVENGKITPTSDANELRHQLQEIFQARAEAEEPDAQAVEA